MSVRARLATFFVLIVVVPMMAIGVVTFRLINDRQQGKGGRAPRQELDGERGNSSGERAKAGYA